MFSCNKFWLAVAALSVCFSSGCFSSGFSLEDNSEYISQSRNSTQQRGPQEQFNFKILQAINPAFYVAFGGTIGERLSYKLAESMFETTADYKQTRPSIGFLGIAGYQLNEMLSFELYYAESAWSEKLTGGGNYVSNVNFSGLPTKYNQKLMALDFGPRTLLALPIHKYFSPYVMAGLSFSYTRSKISYEDSEEFLDPTGGSSSSDKSSSWQIVYGQGYGMRSQITKNFGMRLEFYNLVSSSYARDSFGSIFSPSGSRANLIAYYSF